MHLSRQQTSQFEDEGFLFFPSVFDAAETAVLKQAAGEVYRLQCAEVWREKSGVALAELAG